MTEIRASRDSGIGHDEAEETCSVVSVSPKIGEFAGCTGEHELTTSAGPARKRLVHEHVERHGSAVGWQVDDCRERPAGRCRCPRGTNSEPEIPAFDGPL